MKWFFYLLAFSFCCGLNAQDKVLVDLVETQNGVRYEGEITHYEYGKLLTIRLADGEEVDLVAREIKRIRYAKQRRASSEKTSAQEERIQDYRNSWKKEMRFKKILRRIRPTLALHMNGGKQPNDNNGFFFDEIRLFGFGLEGLIHYQLMPWLQAGIGVGFDRFNTRRSESVLSYLGSIQALPSPKKNIGFVFKLTGGHGTPMNTQSIEFEEASGGVLLHPGLGLRIGKVDETFFTFDLGYRLLSTEISRLTFQGFEVRTNNYRRLSLRIGATF